MPNCTSKTLDDHDNIRKALSLCLRASETAANDVLTYGKIDDFLIGRMNVDDDDDPIVIMALCDLAVSMRLDSADEVGATSLADFGLDQSFLREAMVRCVVSFAAYAWYSGMRRHEICEMEIGKVKLDSEHWHFEVRLYTYAPIQKIKLET